MRFTSLLIALLFFPYVLLSQIEYPETPLKPKLDIYHNVEVEDSYQWLENQESKMVRRWVKNQNKVSLKYLKKQAKKVNSVEQMNRYMFRKIGGYAGRLINEVSDDKVYYNYFYNSNNSTPSLYFKKGKDGDYSILVNTANISSRDEVEITNYKPSNDDQYVAYQYNRNGSDWKELRVVKVQKRRFYKEILKHTKTDKILWLREGFFYEKYPFDSLRAKTKKPSIMYHKLDTSQSEDILIFKSRKESEFVNIYGAKDGSFFLIKKENIETKKYSYFYLDYNDYDLRFKPFLMNIDYNLNGFEFYDKDIYATTTIGEGRRLISIPKNNPYKFKLVSPYYDDAVLVNYEVLNEKIVNLFTSSSGNLFSVVDKNGNLIKEITTPAGLFVSSMGYNKTYEQFFFYLGSYTIPGVLYTLNLDTYTYDISQKTSVNFDPKGYKFIQDKFTSEDGTEVPIYIVYKDFLPKDSNTPFLMTAYGGYGNITSPSYNPGVVYFIENGGAFAYVDIRGGGSLGKVWEDGGKRINKKNGINDFIAAAEYLINKNYTEPKKIAVRGTSHGGLIVAASAIKRPDLFGAVSVNVGVLDMLRFENFTVGATTTNISEFGTVTDSLDFKNLYSYSPYHNIDNSVNYPSMLVTTGANDTRVPSFHSFKFTAKLQNNPVQTHPVLLWTQKKTGHFGAKNKDDKLEENAYVYGFLLSELLNDNQ
ncbi:prolyl oligopeptidase family serine peptidase [Psychroserpens sp. MEBiC05023]